MGPPHLEPFLKAFGRVVASADHGQVLFARTRVLALVLEGEERRADQVFFGVARRRLVFERDDVDDGRHDWTCRCSWLVSSAEIAGGVGGRETERELWRGR